MAQEVKETIHKEDIKDEICQCGHLKSQHKDGDWERGCGKCTICECIRFTWKEFIFKKKIEKIQLI